MAVEIGWRQGSGGSDEVWLMDHGQSVCKLFDSGPEAEDDRQAVVQEWAEKSESLAEFLEMMHLEGLIDLETLQQLLSEHAPLRRIWNTLREFCREAGDIGEYPVTQIFVVPHPFPPDQMQVVLSQEYVTAALQAWERHAIGDHEALRAPTLGIVLADLGVLVGRRLGLSHDHSVHFADWLVEVITGWSMGHGNDRTVARLEDVASHATSGDSVARRRAFGIADFWIDYRPAIAAVVRYLKEHV